jgi:hypothetical protein
MGRAAAQGRKLGDGGVGGADWKTGEVGGAYLFETPQNGARKMPRFPDARDEDTYCDDNACCDNGANYANDIRYKLKTSRRRQPRASSAMTAQSHAESIGPFRKPRND